MPSEAQSQEPRDRGPPPPVTRAGRSALLAKAAASNPLPEKRPRGRPRKDGSTGRAAPPLPPPPPSKSRKKGRSRGRAQVEDEESMDSSQKKRPQRTDVKEVKPTGRQRSASRRKSNSNLEPPRDSPQPEQDPEPDPEAIREISEPNQKEEPGPVNTDTSSPLPSSRDSQLDLSPKPALNSRAEVGSSTISPDPDLDPGPDPNPVQITVLRDWQPATCPSLASNPGKGDQASPNPTSPFHSPVQSPRPGPEEDPCSPTFDVMETVESTLSSRHSPVEKSPVPSPLVSSTSISRLRPIPSPVPSPRPISRPSLIPSPSPSPVLSPVPSPRPISGPSPVESPRLISRPSPVPSPVASPLDSPCPRLSFSPGADDGSLSPLFQPSLSDDSGGSPVPSLGHTKKRLKQCAFCYRGDDPPLGQGHLVVFGPTPGYIPLHILNRRASSERDNDYHDNCYHGNQGMPSCSSPDHPTSNEEFFEQLGTIGLPHDINVQSLFDPTGQCCAHLQCAAWSDGVCRGEGQSLLYVDKAIDAGSTQVCVFCSRLGASLRCRETGCGRSYHFPCAAAAGTHQDWNHRHTLCTRHIHTASSQCVLCWSVGDVSSQLMCCCCGNHYHGSCLKPFLEPTPLIRAGWQCPQCRVCQSCRLRGEESLLVVCECCDKAYHTHCLSPVLEYTPPNKWRCKNCRVCIRCGERSSGQWANHPSLCESCDPDLPCPICGENADPSSMYHLTCTSCYRCVHAECVFQKDGAQVNSDPYICSVCRSSKELKLQSPMMQSPTQIPSLDPPVHSHVHLISSEPSLSPRVALPPNSIQITSSPPSSPLPSCTQPTLDQESTILQLSHAHCPRSPLQCGTTQDISTLDQGTFSSEYYVGMAGERREEETQQEEHKDEALRGEGEEERVEKETEGDKQQKTEEEFDQRTEEREMGGETVLRTEGLIENLQEEAVQSDLKEDKACGSSETEADLIVSLSPLGVEEVYQTVMTVRDPQSSPQGDSSLVSNAALPSSPCPHHSSCSLLSQSDSTSPMPSALLPTSPPSSSPRSLEQQPPSPLSSLRSPPPGAGSPDVSSSPVASLHRTALPLSPSPLSSPQPSPPATQSPSPPHSIFEEHLQEEKETNREESELGEGAGLKESSLSCQARPAHDESQSESLSKPTDVATTKTTKDLHQSHAGPLARMGQKTQEEEGPIEMSFSETSQHSGVLMKTAEQVVTRKQQEEEVEEGAEERGRERMDELGLETSFDMEVMKLMTSSSPPPSLLCFSPSPPLRRGKSRSLRPPPQASCRPSDDLSIRLRQSPFSTEASPESSPARISVTPPPLSLPTTPPRTTSAPGAPESPSHTKSQTCSASFPPPATTVVSLTPKIGMGKPAISKRKFSPGRPRVKQGWSWSSRRVVSPPSSSQDSMGEGGWESPKPHPPGSPLWSMPVGRGSGFPGRRRARGGGVGGGRGGRGRSRLKTQDHLTVPPGVNQLTEEENSMHNTVVMFSTSDHFTLKQDMCVVCGSFGQGAEGRLLACSQCGQCYHPYCVNIKITRVILTKGWRCLECTVCEACGEASDPGRLLLCDDCDISYHTYCLDPPLHTVPKGAWKCKWCVWCLQCGATSPGVRSDWQNNYTQCGPCASLSQCPICQRAYTHHELILLCRQCDRWVHAACQGLPTDEEVEAAADQGFDCTLCQSLPPYGTSHNFDSPYMAQIVSRHREPDIIKTYTQDGVCLTESGLSQLQSLVQPLTSPRRYRRSKPKLKLRIINQNSVSVLQTPPDPETPTDMTRDGEQDDSRGEMECEMKSDSSPEREHAHDDDVTKVIEVTDGNTKRKRKPYRPGIGGFMVRQRGGKVGPGRAPPVEQVEKVRKRYRKKKTKLEEAFPSYLQEAFFGRDLLDRSRQLDRKAGLEAVPVCHSQSGTGSKNKSTPLSLREPFPSTTLVSGTANRKQKALPMVEETLVDLSDVLNTDPHILATEHTAGLDLGSMAEDPSLSSEPRGSGGYGHRVAQEEPLDAILSPELDKMVTDGAILGKLYKIPELGGKDVEDLFTAVLSPGSSTTSCTSATSTSQLDRNPPTYTPAGTKTLPQSTGGEAFHCLPVVNGVMGAAPHYAKTPMMPSGGGAPVSGIPTPHSNRKLSQLGGDLIDPWGSSGPVSAPASTNPSGGEGDGMSTAQKSMLKWEKEETLGEMATVAPVLYSNINYPTLREQYQDWSTRVKQIAKLWRKASSQDRAPYVQKARDNRAALRINKVHMSNEPLKRHQSQKPPYEPVSMETEMIFKDPLKPKESEQEQEWKFRQGEVNDRWRAGKKRQENLPKSKALDSPTDKDCPYLAPVTGAGKEALQMRQKSKQQAKIEATQKLEKVKNEQLQQQRQQQQHLLGNQLLTGGVSLDTGSPSLMITPQQPAAGGSASPLQPCTLKEGQVRPHPLLGHQSSGLTDDIFLKPQAPPPSGFSQSHLSSPHPHSSRPSSPWDPYNMTAGGPPPQQQRRNSLSTSPVHDAPGSSSPDAKPFDPQRRPMGVQQGPPRAPDPQQGRLPSGSAPDISARQPAIQRPPHNNNTNIRMAGGGVFKAPMPPHSQQEVYSSSTAAGGAGRSAPSSTPTELGFPLSQEPPFASYAPAPGTPHPNYSQTPDPFNSRPSPDPPATPRPNSESSYLSTPAMLRIDQFGQQAASRRPSPSHSTHLPLDSYSSMPGTPHPSAPECVPQSPGSQRSAELYSQAQGTPRLTGPADSFPPQPASSGMSPLAPVPSGETSSFSQAHHQQSPGRAPDAQTPKHSGICEEGSFSSLASHTPGHDAFEHGHMTPRPQQMDKTATNELAAVGGPPLDGPMSMLPQLGDSEEKLRQRQRLRQLILRQQQQKSALRQEKAFQEPVSGHTAPPSATPGPATGPGTDPATPHHWSQGSSIGPQQDLFNRPPPPYPGTSRPAGVFPPSQAPYPQPNLPRQLGGPGANVAKLGLRGQAMSFGFPAEGQESFMRAGLGLPDTVPVQMRRPLSGDFTTIRPVGGLNNQPQPQMMPGGPAQPFLPHSLPPQQHSIMGQPFIELRHRAPESRIRLPYPLPAPLELNHSQSQGSQMGPGTRMGKGVLGQQDKPAGGQIMGMKAGMEPPNQGLVSKTHPLSATQSHHENAAPGLAGIPGADAGLAQSSEAVLPAADGIEEEGEDSAVKDLEDVEVKDLVDLNLNLDQDDGKEDLDLGPNDLHLDDFLLSGKFDLIAYADPELNLEDKKDMFNEELELGEEKEEREEGGEPHKGVTERREGFTVGMSRTPSQVKQELNEENIKSEAKDFTPLPPQPSALAGLVTSSRASAPLGANERASVLLPGSPQQAGQEAVESGSGGGVVPVPQSQEHGSTSGGVLPVTTAYQQQHRGFHLNPQTQPPHTVVSSLNQPQQHPGAFPQKPLASRPLLLEEQPLLLQDLLDQERQEQQHQKHMQAMIRQRTSAEPTLPNIDFDSISDPIMKAKMVALQGINKVVTQSSLTLHPMVINRFQHTSGAQGPEGPLPPSHLTGEQEGKPPPQLVRPAPPSLTPGFVNDSQRQQYEEWLGDTQQLLQIQQRLLEEQIAAHRKAKKALSAKQRTAKKVGRPFAEEDALQLHNISEQQGAVQKQLEQIRKQQKEHAELIEDYRNQQQQQRALLQQQPHTPLMPPAAPPMVQTLLPQNTVPMQPQPGGPTPARIPNIPPAWTPGAGHPEGSGQRLPPNLPPQMPPVRPNAPQPLTQNPAAMVPSLAAPPTSFPPPVPGPEDGDSSGAAGAGVRVCGTTAAPQVKFDDNNPFSEGFQERERRERLREQQERQRVQLMQEVDRHHSLQQHLELEQQGMLGASVSRAAASGESLSQMPIFSSELPQDFMQSPLPSRAPQQQPALLPSHLAQGSMRGAISERGRAPPGPGSAVNNSASRARLPGPGAVPAQSPARPAGIGGHHGSPSLIQLYSDVIPEEKPKKKRNRKREGEDSTGGGTRTPLSSHSDDITAPPTPAVSETSCSTPTRGTIDQSDLSFPQTSSHSSFAPSELEQQLSARVAAQDEGSEAHRAPLSAAPLEVKEEKVEGWACGGGMVKVEEAGAEGYSCSPLHGDGGKELLKHLLKDTSSPATTPSPSNQVPPARCQLSIESIQSEEEEGKARAGSYGNMNMVVDSVGSVEFPEGSESVRKKQQQRCKRPARQEGERAPPKSKRRKREEEDKRLCSSSNTANLMTDTQLQLSLLPLMEPVMGVSLALFPPYGSSSLDRDSRLIGSFGNASLDGVTDYYSQLIYKSNLSNPPTPPASLPPTPPPVARQKLVNGFASTDELKTPSIREQDDVSGLKRKGEQLLALSQASKTVDVPASLPTPPHNNQEDVRVQELEGRHSPDSFVPSSSPESVVDMEISRYPDISHIKLEPPSPCPSPTIPIMPCTWGKGSAVKQEIKVEPNHLGPPSCSSTGLVSIAITLNPMAAQNVPGVMAAVADLLRVPVPVSYQLIQLPNGATAPAPALVPAERSSLALLAGIQIPQPQGLDSNKQIALGSHQTSIRPTGTSGTPGAVYALCPVVRMDYRQHGSSQPAAKPQCCSHCKVLLGNVVRNPTKALIQEDQVRGSGPVFCTNCSALYSSGLQPKPTETKAVVPGIPAEGSRDSPPSNRIYHQYTNNMSIIAVHCLPLPSSSPPPPTSSPHLSFPPASVLTMDTKPRTDSLKVTLKLKPRSRTVPGGDDSSSLSSSSSSPRHGKRIKSSHWRRWSVHITLPRGPSVTNQAVAIPTEEEIDVLLRKLGACLRPDPLPRDQRRCCFCHQQGDGKTDGPARLLNLDLDLWVHLNCALWSSEVYETQAGALINVELALRRGLTLRCAHCQQTGATSGCNRLRCTNTYHFTCAVQAHCTFFKDKTMLCHLHKPKSVSPSVDKLSTTGALTSSSCSPSSTPALPRAPSPTPDPYDSELRCFSVFRRVYVQRDEARQIAAIVQRGERQHTFRVGSLVFRSIGRLLPHQMPRFHNNTAIFPVGYQANRIYWSMRHGNRRCKYMCSVEEREGEPLFRLKVVEKGYDDALLTGPSPKAVWDQVLEPVSKLRSCTGTLKLFPAFLKGEDLFGLTTSAVTRIIESLPGVEVCERYSLRYGRNPLMEWPLAFNPTGSARSEPKACQAKRPYLLTSIAPRCQGSVGPIVGLVPGVLSLTPGEFVAGAPQGRHSKSSQYRRMKAEWKSNVYLARSRIQGLGLYAARDFEKCTMVIEYIGTIIRSEVANRKERLYESQNRGVYMFRIDNDYVIDATITGGPARYINHSCAPNCITEVVTVEKENKIIISSSRRIQRGEELSYDYKFDLEDDQHKIPCHCGALNCRKWMN
ncbi:histone-lysine N-methyltransferase 2C [Lampris incognitus]|uniref:histone-lysine N-methyltransferase 2C n=1 Tax=Lampris incognitus TaxID=2546036 RepID=UPI0024B53F75|nr:histone-lysine N-methyltransferase 2C [Lampris incognitus]